MEKQTKKWKIKPTARENRRYFLTTATEQELEEALLEYLGILGLAKSGFVIIKEKQANNKTIGSCTVKSINDVRTALISKKIIIERVSGTIKGVLNKK